MAEIRKGMLARSRAGHDAGALYVITEADDTYVYLAVSYTHLRAHET